MSFVGSLPFWSAFFELWSFWSFWSLSGRSGRSGRSLATRGVDARCPKMSGRRIFSAGGSGRGALGVSVPIWPGRIFRPESSSPSAQHSSLQVGWSGSPDRGHLNLWSPVVPTLCRFSSAYSGSQDWHSLVNSWGCLTPLRLCGESAVQVSPCDPCRYHGSLYPEAPARARVCQFGVSPSQRIPVSPSPTCMG